MRQKVLSLFLAGALTGVGPVALAGDLFRAQSPWGPPPGAAEEYAPADEGGHFEEGTGTTSWYAPPEHNMYFRAGVLWLSRNSDLQDQPLVVELPPSSTPVITTDTVDLDSSFRPGAIFTLGFNSDQVSSFEFIYWGLQDYSNGATATASGQNFLGLAGTLQLSTVDFIFADRMSVNYSSRLHNAEANHRQTIEGVTLLAGFRYFNLNEQFTITSQSALTGTSSDYSIETQNNLIGGQVGVGYDVCWGRFSVGVEEKFGVFGNVASQNTFLGDFGNSIVRRDYRDESIPTSLMSETLVQAHFQVLEWLAIEGGYRFLWIQNVAYAPSQLDLTDSPAGTEVIDPRGRMLLQGLHIGAEARW